MSPDDGFVTFRLRDDELVRISGFGCRVDFFARGIEPAELDVFENRVVKQKGILRNQSDLFAKRYLRQSAQIMAVDPHYARGRIVKPKNERKNGALTRAAGPDQGVSFYRARRGD